jgi:hypothetical protein
MTVLLLNRKTCASGCSVEAEHDRTASRGTVRPMVGTKKRGTAILYELPSSKHCGSTTITLFVAYHFYNAVGW